MTALLVALGGALGAPARYLVARTWDGSGDHRTPWGTLAVNLVGSAVLGWLVGHGVEGRPMALFGVGFCGALTTYSAVAVQAVDRGRFGIFYAVGTVLACLAIAWVGYLVS